MTSSIVPGDSILHHWIDSLSITELPVSFVVFSGLSALGAMLKRNIFVDQERWEVYPNLSLLLVGPSGIGKDITINHVRKLITKLGVLPVLGGTTMEYIKSELFELGDPAAGFLPAAELTAFLGGKDYQKSMVQEITDLLSTGDSIDISLRSTGKRVIHRPTITMMAGSTKEWLHRAMPEGSLDGGLFPRFLILCEEYNSKFIPWVKYSNMKCETSFAAIAGEQFVSGISMILSRFATPVEFLPLSEAQEVYANWYHNRFRFFSKAVAPYANRSRDQVLRLALIMAASRHHNYIDAEDIQFGITSIGYVASKIDEAVKPSTLEAQCAKMILAMLPASIPTILIQLSRHHPKKLILEALDLLRMSGQLAEVKPGVYTRREGV